MEGRLLVDFFSTPAGGWLRSFLILGLVLLVGCLVAVRLASGDHGDDQ